MKMRRGMTCLTNTQGLLKRTQNSIKIWKRKYTTPTIQIVTISHAGIETKVNKM